jgi:hypothetical protein
VCSSGIIIYIYLENARENKGRERDPPRITTEREIFFNFPSTGGRELKGGG